MNLSDILGFDHFPTLDLHGYDRESARVAIDDFIRDHKKLHQKTIVIVHGIGSGIIREMTHETLKKNRDIEEFKTSYFNRGCTIAKIK